MREVIIDDYGVQGTDDLSAFVPGTVVLASDGNEYIVTGVYIPKSLIGLKRSTWWRRLYYRVKRLFA
jgi:hypothetical protein